MTENLKELAMALAKAQAEMKNATLNKVNPHFKSKYADLAEIIDTTRETLAKHGLSVVQTTLVNDGVFVLRTTLLHTSGQFIHGDYPLPMVLDKPQAMGSALTYARRYSLAAIANISAEEDDDANAAQAEGKNIKPITAAQVKQLSDLADEVSADKAKFCRYLNVSSLADIPAGKFKQAVDALEAKRPPQAEAAE
ncbi:MAG: ERF family protein [Xanthobacteraceae bacterium]|nr:ERF family protein [Xanthobacteraceae bacterium]